MEVEEFKIRVVYEKKNTPSSVTSALLQNFFLAELISPNPEKIFWLVSAWISDVSIIDNRAGTFDSINPEWARRRVRISEFISYLLELGMRVNIVTNDQNHNDEFISRVRLQAESHDQSNLLCIKKDEGEHAKTIVGSHGMIKGSMNITYGGIEIQQNAITYTVNTDEIQIMRDQLKGTHGEILDK